MTCGLRISEYRACRSCTLCLGNRTAVTVTVSGEYKVEKGEKGVYTACDDVADQNSEDVIMSVT
jgi:hypothetical protein